MTEEYKLLKEAYDSIASRIPYKPEIAFTLGTGLGDYVENLKIDSKFDFDEIANFPRTTNHNHKGRFIFTHINGVKTLVMQGRLHFYEGYKAIEVVRPVRLASMLGAKMLILTNASGGINKKFKKGDIMMIKDQISFFMPNPLYGPNVEEFGTRFPDMSNIYDLKLQELMRNAAKKARMDLKEGIYVQMMGPSFESPADIKALRHIGADAVAMSTAVEAIAARHAGMKVCGLSTITNMAAGITKEELRDEDVRKNASIMTAKLCKLINEFIKEDLLKEL